MRQLRKNIKSLFGVCIDMAGFPKSKIIMCFLIEILKRLWDLLPTLCYYILLHMVIENKNVKILPYVLALYLVVFIVQTLIAKIEVNVRNSANAKILSLLRNIAMNKLLNKELVYTSNNESDMKCLVHDDSEQITEFFSQSIGFLCSILSFLITFIIILVLQWKLALICFAIIPISFWITNKVNKKSYSGYEKQRTLDVKYNEFAEDVFNDWIDIRANGIEKYERDNYSAIWKEIGENNFKVHLFWFINKTLITFKDIFATRILIYFLGGLLIVYSQFSVAALIVFVDYYGSSGMMVGEKRPQPQCLC